MPGTLRDEVPDAIADAAADAERDAERPGPLDGIRVVEVASDHAAFAGKMLADLGADVVLVEPPGGHPSRRYAPFAGDVVDPERSLWWWHYHTSKRGVVLDLDDARDGERFRRLVATADVVLEGEPPGRLDALGLDHPALRGADPRLVWTSVTPFGRESPRRDEQATDLTVLAGGGPVWSCGYDDHTIPPVRGGGNQGYQTASLWAAAATLVALLHRDVSGEGQHVDVSMHAAANVTTEAGSYEWLVARATVQRQTGRHATVRDTTPTQLRAADGRHVSTGLAPSSVEQLTAVRDWMDHLGLRERHSEPFWLDVGIERGGVHLSQLGQDVEVTAIFGAAREAVGLIVEALPAYEVFVEAQRRGLTCGIVYAPEEVIADPHFVARGFPATLHHDELGRDVTYPGAPFLMPASPWRLSRRAPRLGEHDAEVLGPLDG